MRRMKRAIISIMDDLVLAYLSYRRRSVPGMYRKMAVYAHDFVGNQVSVRGAYEIDELNALESVIKANCEDRAILDVGANIGNHSLFLSALAPEVHAFEPSRDAVALLRLNAERSQNVQIHEFGLSDDYSTKTAWIPPENLGGAKIIQSGDSEHDSIAEFKVQPFDGIRALVSRQIGFVKIDVEGHELAVLRGMRETLMEDKPLVLFETNYSSLDDGSHAAVEALRGIGYDVFFEVATSASAVSQGIPRLLRWPLRIVERFVRDRSTISLISTEEFGARSYPVVLAAIRSEHNIKGAVDLGS